MNETGIITSMAIAEPAVTFCSMGKRWIILLFCRFLDSLLLGDRKEGELLGAKVGVIVVVVGGC